MARSGTSTQLKLWVLLTTAFTVVGACAVIAISTLNLSRAENDERAELLTIAKILSVQFSASADKIQESDDSSNLLQLKDYVARSQDQGLDVRHIALVKKSSGQYRAIIDSRENEGLGGRRYNLSNAGIEVFGSGMPAVSSTVEQDDAGDYLTGYAPVFDAKGRVIALAIVERSASKLVAYVSVAKRIALIAMLIVVFLGSIFALIVVRQLVGVAKNEAWYRARIFSKVVLGVTVLELVLATLTCGVIAMGLYSQLRLSQLRADEENSSSRAAPIKQLQNRIARILKDDIRDDSTLLILANWAASEGLSDLASALGNSRGKSTSDWKEPVWQAMQAIATRLDQETQNQATLRTEMKAVGDNLTTTFVLTILLSFGALVIVRTAANQRQRLTLAQQDSVRHKVAYEQVSKNLPIGFYTFTDGEIEDANLMWDQQVTRQPGEDRMMALERAVDAQDLLNLKRTLTHAEEKKRGFELKFKINSGLNEIRHFETRGVYVSKPDEGLESLLGFFLDVTEVVQTTNQLEISNQEVSAKNFMLTKALGDLENNLEAMVHGLVKAVEAKDPYTAGHSERVMRYSMLIGEQIGLSANELRILQRGTLIHDVGKIGIPDDILMKPARLDDREFRIIQKHPTIGASMIQGIPVFEDCLPIVLSHHERLDGNGYPHGLMGDEIPLMVRIASVTDVFDALTSNRAYRTAMPLDTALEILRKDASLGILDKKIVEVLADIVMREGILDSDFTDKAA